MALPVDLNLREVIGNYVDYSGNPVTGQIRFESSVRLVSDGSDTAVLPSVILATLVGGQLKAEDGVSALMLPSTEDTDLYPTGWAYSVTEVFDDPFVGIAFNLSVPVDDVVPLDLPSVTPSTLPTDPGVQAVTQVNGVDPDSVGLVTLAASDIGAAPAVHTHPTTDVTGLATVASSGSYNDLLDKPAPSTVDWTGVLNKPTEFTPEAHTHTASEITGLAMPVSAEFSRAGQVGVETGTHRWYNDTGILMDLSSIRASVGTPPSGSGLGVSLLKNGVAVASATIAADTNTIKATVASVTVADGEYLTVDVTSVGSVTTGSNLVVQATMAAS